MLDLYKNIKTLLIGSESFSLFICGLIVLFLFTVTMSIADSKFNKHYDNFLNEFFPSISKFIDHYAFHIKIYGSKQVIMFFIVFAFTFKYDSTTKNNILSFIREYAFLFFVLISFKSFVNIKYSKRWFVAFDNILSLQSSEEDSSMLKGSIKNKKELNCDRCLTAVHSDIKCTELKLNILKHFVGPTIIAPFIVCLDAFQSNQQLQNFLIDISLSFIVVVLFLFWINYKNLKQDYRIYGNYESTLYHIKNKVEYTKEELDELRKQKFSRQRF